MKSKDKKEYVDYNKGNGVCIFCNKDEEEGVDCGKLLTDKDRQLFVHKYCLLFASGLPQAGADSEGIEGFLVRDILKEFRRGRRLNCFYCHKKTATIGCSVSVCKRSFHFNCGVKNEALFCFFDAFLAHCRLHRPQQDVKVSKSDPATVTCPICFDDVEARVSNHTLKTPCCTNTWFHRNCVQRQALSAGYFFRCAICNNEEQFQNEMKKFGIYIPEHDASWETEDNAFQELYWRHDKCDIDPCVCPKGRQFTKASSKWELVLCDLCGSSGCHLACGGLKSVNQDWACSMCNAMMSNATEVSPSSASPQKSPCPGGTDSPSKTGQTTRTAMKLMGKHPRTPLSSHTFRKKTASSPFSSLKLPSSPEEIANLAQDSCGLGGSGRKNSFESSDFVGSLEHCQPSTSKHGLEDADYRKGKKRKFSCCSKENDLNYSLLSPENRGFKKHYTRKTQSADQLSNKNALTSGLIYGPRTTLRMSMRPRQIELLQCPPVNNPGNTMTSRMLKQSSQIHEKFDRSETISFPTVVTNNSESISMEGVSSSQKVLVIGKPKDVTPEPSSCSPEAIAGGISVNKSMLKSPRHSLVPSHSQSADNVGLKIKSQTSFRKKLRNATVTRPVEEEPLSYLAAKLEGAGSTLKTAVPNVTESHTNQGCQLAYDKPDGNFSGNQQLINDLDSVKPPPSRRDNCSPISIRETSRWDSEKPSAMTQGLASGQFPSSLQTYMNGSLGETDVVTANHTSCEITEQADTDILKQEQNSSNSPKNATPPPDDTSKCLAETSDITKDTLPEKESNKAKTYKRYVYRYKAIGSKWRKYKRKRRSATCMNDKTKSTSPAVHHNNLAMDRNEENGMVLSSAQVDVQPPKSVLHPEKFRSAENPPGNTSECSPTLFTVFDNTECVNSPKNATPLPDYTSKCLAETSDIAKDALPEKESNRAKTFKRNVYRYEAFGSKWRKYRWKRPSAGVNKKTKSTSPAVHHNNSKMGRNEENGMVLSSAEVDVRPPKSVLHPEKFRSAENPPGNTSECSPTLFTVFDNTECVIASASGHEDVTKPHVHVGAELQDNVYGTSANTTPCPSPRCISDHDSLSQLSPCGVTPHYPLPGCHPSSDHRALSGLPPSHHENSSQQTLSLMEDKTNLTRPPSTETLTKDQVKVESVDLSPGKSSHSDATKDLKPDLLPASFFHCVEITTSQAVESLQRASTPVKLPGSVTLEDGQIHSDIMQEFENRICESPSDMQQLPDGDTSCQDVKTPHSQKSKQTAGSKDVQPWQRQSTAACGPNWSENAHKTIESQSILRLTTGMLLRRRICSNKESVPSQKTETAGEELTLSSINVDESSCIHVTDVGWILDTGSGDSNTVKTPSKGFELVRNQSVIERSKESPQDESCSTPDRVRGSEIHGVRRSTGKLLRRTYIRDCVENPQALASDEGEKGIERERPGSLLSYNQAQETSPRPDLIPSGTSEVNIAQGEKILTMPRDETDGDISIEDPAIKSEASSSDNSPDSGISQGFSCDQEDSPLRKPHSTPTKTNEPALVNLTEEIQSDSVEKQDEPFALKQSGESSPNTPLSNTSNHKIAGSENNPIDASDEENLIESRYFEPVKTDSVPNSPISESSQTASSVKSVCSSSDSPKDTKSPQTVRSDSSCSIICSPQSNDDSVPNVNPQMNLMNPSPQTSVTTLLPRTPPIKPTQREPSLTFSGRDEDSSVRLLDSSTKPMSCPGKCQSERASEILERSHRSLRKRDGQKLYLGVRANLFKVREDRGRPLKRPRIDSSKRPVSPLVSGKDVLVTTRNKTRIYASNSLRTASQKEMNNVHSRKSQMGSISGGAINEECLGDCHSPKVSTLLSAAESPQRPWLLRSQTKKGHVGSASPLPSPGRDKSCKIRPRIATPDASLQSGDTGSAHVGDKSKGDVQHSSRVRPSRKPRNSKTPNTPTGLITQGNSEGGVHTGPVSSFSLTPKVDTPQGSVTTRRLLTRSCSKNGDKSSLESMSPLCSPLPSSPVSSSPKQPRIYRSLPQRAVSNKYYAQTGIASSALIQESTKSPHIKPARSRGPAHLGASSNSPVFLPNSSSSSKCSTRSPKFPRQEDLRKTKGRVQLFMR